MASPSSVIARAGGLLGALALVACDFKTEGLETLVDGYASYIMLPGNRLASGRFSHHRTDGDSDHGPYVVAVENGQDLTLVPFAGSAPCRVGAVSRYQIFRDGPAVSSSPAPLVAYLETSDAQGRGRLGFVGPDCSRWSSGLEHAELPRLASASAYVVRDARPEGDALVVVDPWNRTTTELATLVLDAQADRERGTLWSIEGGTLVVRRPDLTEMARFGSNVTELVASIGDDTAAVIEGGNLWVLTKGDDKVDPRTMIEDACQIALADIWNYPPIHLGYLSPCAEQRPNLFHEATGGLFTFTGPAQGVNAPLFVAGWSSPLEAFFLTGAAPAAPFPRITGVDRDYVGTLWGGPIGGISGGVIDVQHVGDNALLASIRPCQSGANPKVVVDYDGTTGRLVEWQGAAGVDRATGVSEFSGCYAIANFAGQAGDLLSVAKDTVVLAHGVPTLERTGSTVHGGKLPVLAEYNGTTGALLLVVPSTAAAERVADKVPKDGFGAILGFPALGYIRDFDPSRGAGTLGFRFLTNGDTFEQPGASEWREVSSPDPGVLYAVPDGGNAGIWYALAK